MMRSVVDAAATAAADVVVSRTTAADWTPAAARFGIAL